jgi:hypothetical protein
VTRFPTRVFDRFFNPRMPEPYAGPTHRWLLWLLFLTVMLVFPGLEFLSALIGLADVIAGRGVDPLGDYSTSTVVVTVAFSAVPIGMVWLFQRLTGDRLVRLGLLARPGRETAGATWWTFVWIFALGGLLEFGLSVLLSYIPFATRYTAQVELGSGVSLTHLALVAVPTALSAGFVEEIVVLGFAYRVLERAGLSDRAILAVLVILRMSYHLYYGVGALVLLPWAFLSVVYYRRYRRLWPLIIGHAFWDVYAILSSASVAAQVIGLVIVAVVVAAAVVGAGVRGVRVRRGPVLTLEIPRPRPQWATSPTGRTPRHQPAPPRASLPE